jgi:hypothetical protein
MDKVAVAFEVNTATHMVPKSRDEMVESDFFREVVWRAHNNTQPRTRCIKMPPTEKAELL